MDLAQHIRTVPDFPKPGILFYDISTLLAQPHAWKHCVLQLGFVMVRKQGKLPGETVRHVYELEYGTDTVEIQADAIKPGQRVVVLDDLMATGGTMTAAIELIRKVGGTVAGVACIIELEGLGGRDEIDVPFKSLVQFEI